MGIRKTHLTWLAPLWVLCSPGCTSEETPLADGLRFEYHIEHHLHNYVVDFLFVMTVKEVDDEHFLLDLKWTPRGHKEIRVDRFFQIESGERAEYRGVPLWLPSSQRREGAKVVASNESFRIRKETTWEDWNVWVGYGVDAGASINWYYERDTGFLVGYRITAPGTGMSLKLVKTNAPGL